MLCKSFIDVGLLGFVSDAFYHIGYVHIVAELDKLLIPKFDQIHQAFVDPLHLVVDQSLEKILGFLYFGLRKPAFKDLDVKLDLHLCLKLSQT